MRRARVISSGTFYPQDVAHPEQDQTIFGTMAFIKSNLDSHLDYIKGREKSTVFHTWNDILFMISGRNESPYFLDYQLQILHNIATFLFGQRFERKMLHDISKSNCDIFEKYVDCFLQISEKDPRSQLSIVDYLPEYRRITRELCKRLPIAQIPPGIGFMECIILKDYKVIARIARDGRQLFDYNDLFMLSLYARVEHKDVEDDGTVVEFDANYVNQVDRPSVRHRAGYFCDDGTIRRCSIASTRLGKNSPYIALFVTGDAYDKEQRDLIMNVMGIIAISVQDTLNRVRPETVSMLPGFVQMAVVNRTTGEFYTDHGTEQEFSRDIAELLFARMPERVLDAVYKGHHMMVWNDGLFKFCYELKFVNDTGVLVSPEFPSYELNDDIDVMYRDLVPKLFSKKDHVNCFEVFSIYVSPLSTEDIINVNTENFKVILDRQWQWQWKRRSVSVSRSTSDTLLGQSLRSSRSQSLLKPKEASVSQPDKSPLRSRPIPKSPTPH